LHGNSKLPHFQYANYANEIVDKRKEIHRIIRDFLDTRKDIKVSTLPVAGQHAMLYERMKKVKGVGPLSFNQLWHSLCLCGILPHNYIEYSVISPNAGPSKLIQVFHAEATTMSTLGRVMSDIKGELNKLGLEKVTGFFLENMLCELWRIITTKRLQTETTTSERLKECLLSDTFQSYVKDSFVTRFPDVHFTSPYTEDCQHLFRVMDKKLFMRPSFLENSSDASVLLQCNVSYDNNQLCDIQWSGGCMKRTRLSADDFFMKIREGGE
jgi:hypothetical protein